MKLVKKVALVSGGGSGIGEAIVRKLCHEGAIVYIGDLNDASGLRLTKELEHAGQQAKFIHLDVTQLRSWSAAISLIESQQGRLDILVNNAGMANSGQTMEDMNLERDWDRLIQIDLNGSFYGMYAAIPSMKRSGGGSIVNIASVAGLVAQCGVNGYTAAKGAVIALTRSAAVDNASNFVRCNAICPSSTLTPAVQRIMDTTPGVKEALAAECVLPRLGLPEDIANAVAFLGSDEASYITGQILAVDGGYVAR